ncbi:hypothetical protein TA3x_000836 [Tundrisphaera sp. TA3]|uniref:hypothetical protein n=1 Tax=Tundrisphaera sp. TA3 TaxID=3435775 RepID=UPI003EB7ED90
MAILCLASAGCVGPAAVRSTRLRYNEVIRATNDEQLLTNLVRLRYADSPVFIDLPNITSQFEVSGTGNYNGGYGLQFPGRTSLGTGEITIRDTPTLSYHPRQGREIAKALLDPLSADLLSVVNAGARLDQLFWLALNDINDVQNAAQATVLIPRVPDRNDRFRRGIQLLAEIDDRGGAEIGFATSEEGDETSDPIPIEQVGAQDLMGAAKDGYVFRARGDRMALLKRDRQLTLKIRAPFRDSPEMAELAEIFNLTPGLGRYKIKSELQPGAESSPLEALPVEDTIYLNLRSVLQIMTFLSKGVCVPEEHARDGTAPMTPDIDGRPFDWTSVTAGQFFVASQKRRPADAEVAIQYRGYWFYIPRQDVNSRSVLAVLEIIFSLQESDEKAAGPVLTLPTGG